MHNSDLRSLVAEAIISRPRKLGLASPFEQVFIKQFQQMLGKVMHHPIEITFAHRGEEGKITIGVVPVSDADSKKCVDYATVVLEAMKESFGLPAQATITGIPNDGIFLLHEFEQACDIASGIQSIDYDAVQFAYTACLTLGQSSNKKCSTNKLIEILCQYSDKSIDAGEWRTSAVCLDYAERLLIGEINAYTDNDLDKLLTVIGNIGEAFCYANLPERAVNLALNSSSPSLVNGFSNPVLQKFQQSLADRLQEWQEASDILWRTNSPIFEVGEALLQKQAA